MVQILKMESIKDTKFMYGEAVKMAVVGMEKKAAKNYPIS